VTYNDQAIPNASLTAVDLATGQALPLAAWSDTAGAGATGTQRTDAAGTFELALPKLAGDQVVKLVATTGSQTFSALFDARGRAVGADGQQGAGYRLQQGQAVAVTVRVQLTAATTAATEAFEGALKLTLQLPEEVREAERAAIFTAASLAASRLATALASRPALAERLVGGLGAGGEVTDVDAFRTALAKLGVFDTIFEGVRGRLVAVTAHKLTSQGTLAPIAAADFPLDRVTISRTGAFTFTGASEPVSLGGGETGAFVPTPERARRRRAPGEPPESFVPFAAVVGSGYAVCVLEGAGQRGYTLVPSDLTDQFQVFDAGGNQVAANPLGSAMAWILGAEAYPAGADIFVVGMEAGTANRRVTRLAAGPNWTYTRVDGHSAGSGFYTGAAIAARRLWTLEYDAPGTYRRIASFDLDNLAAGPQHVASGAAALDLMDEPFWPPGQIAYRDLAVQADGSATHIFLVTSEGSLYRITEGSGTSQTTATRIFSALPGAIGAGSVASSGDLDAPVFVVSRGRAYKISSPATAQADTAASESLGTVLTDVSGADLSPRGTSLVFRNFSTVQRINTQPVP
jgi:hypothetical protein